MSFEIGGYGYEFETKHFGGPYDGLDSSIISFEEFPPKNVFYPLDDKLEGEKTLGKKLLNKWKEKHISDDTRVAVYGIEGDPEEYNDEDVINYHFKGSMVYSEYKELA